MRDVIREFRPEAAGFIKTANIGRYYPKIKGGILPEFSDLANTPNIGWYYPMIQGVIPP